MVEVKLKSFAKDPTHISKEDEAAIQLEERLREDLKAYPNAKGTLYILTSIRIFGQKRNDIDILLMGFFENFKIKKAHTKNHGEVDELNIKSIICNIELKSHSSSSVRHEGTNYIVYYNGIAHNVRARFEICPLC